MQFRQYVGASVVLAAVAYGVSSRAANADDGVLGVLEAMFSSAIGVVVRAGRTDAHGRSSRLTYPALLQAYLNTVGMVLMALFRGLSSLVFGAVTPDETTVRTLPDRDT